MAGTQIIAAVDEAAVLIIDTADRSDPKELGSSTAPPPRLVDWSRVLLDLDLAPHILKHVNARVVRSTCRAWRGLEERLLQMGGQYMRDVHLMRTRGETDPVQSVTCPDELPVLDVTSVAHLGGEILCVADASGVITLWRLEPPRGDAGRRLGALYHHHFGAGSGRVFSLVPAAAGKVISVGLESGGLGSCCWCIGLREGAKAELERGDELEFMSEEGGGEEEEGVGVGRRRRLEPSALVTCRQLAVPFGTAPPQLGFDKLAGLLAAADGRWLYVTPTDPVDDRADYVPMIGVWEWGGQERCPDASEGSFRPVGCVPTRTRQFATAVAAHGGLAFSAHRGGIRVWRHSSAPAGGGATDAPPLQLATILVAARACRGDGGAPCRLACAAGCGALAVTSEGVLCAAVGCIEYDYARDTRRRRRAIEVWRPREWHGGGVIAYELTARLEHPGCVSSMLVFGPRLVSADTDVGYVRVWDVGFSEAQAHLGVISSFVLDSYLSAVNALALLELDWPRDGGCGGANGVHAHRIARLYTGHDASRSGPVQVACWW